MSIRFSFLFFIFMSSGIGFAQETPAVLHRVAEYQSPFSSFPAQAYENPALVFYRYDSSRIELTLEVNGLNRNRARMMQQGEDARDFRFHAQSWYQLDKRSVAWGEAGYVNGEKTDVQWNETSDFEVVYPYVMADTTGGGLRSETYSFKGGYVREIQGLTWGIVMDYRAQMEYRKKDPRPRNVVSDLEAKTGILWKTGGGYAFGASFGVRKYKQTNNVKFFSELGAYKVYHLTGLGMDYVRFAGATNNAYYKGSSWGGSLEAYPLKKKGVAFSLAYSRFSFDKILPDFNDLPLAAVVENQGKGELTWLRPGVSGKWNLTLAAEVSKREGTENLFGDPSGNAYPQIGKAKQYRNKKIAVEIYGGYESRRKERFHWGLLPILGYQQAETHYLSPGRHMEIQELKGGGMIFSSCLKGNYLFWFSASGMRYQNMGSALLLNGLKENEPVGEMLRYNYAQLSAHRTEAGLSARVDYSGWLDNKTLFVKASCFRMWGQEDFRQTSLSVALGFVF